MRTLNTLKDVEKYKRGRCTIAMIVIVLMLFLIIISMIFISIGLYPLAFFSSSGLLFGLCLLTMCYIDMTYVKLLAREIRRNKNTGKKK